MKPPCNHLCVEERGCEERHAGRNNIHTHFCNLASYPQVILQEMIDRRQNLIIDIVRFRSPILFFSNIATTCLVLFEMVPHLDRAIFEVVQNCAVTDVLIATYGWIWGSRFTQNF